MVIGIVSDTHGRATRLRAALEIFAARNVQAIVHCGDIGSIECVELLGEMNIPAYAVGGNMDYRFDDMERVADICGVNFAWDSIAIPLTNGACVAAAHGHDQRVLSALIKDPANKFVLHGHTHRQHNEHSGTAHVINPGALYNCRGPGYPTVAVLDTEQDRVEFLEVP